YSDAAKVQISNLGEYCMAGGAQVNKGQIGHLAACDPDWSMWRLSSRTMWNPVANLDVGLEVAYTQVNTAFEGGFDLSAGNPANTGLSKGGYHFNDTSVWSATLRVQRSFWP
ncbi:MAG: hypothetical protein AB7F49_28160, partial [Pseudorhodoplanes sp.]